MWAGKETARGWGRDRERRFPPLSLLIFSRSLTSRHTPLPEHQEQTMFVWLHLCRSCKLTITDPFSSPQSPFRFVDDFCFVLRVSRFLKRNQPTIPSLRLLRIFFLVEFNNYIHHTSVYFLYVGLRKLSSSAFKWAHSDTVTVGTESFCRSCMLLHRKFPNL